MGFITLGKVEEKWLLYKKSFPAIVSFSTSQCLQVRTFFKSCISCISDALKDAFMNSSETTAFPGERLFSSLWFGLGTL